MDQNTDMTQPDMGTGGTVKDKVQAAASAAKDAGAAIASDLKSRAADTISGAREAAADRAGQMADQMSDAGVRLADNLRDVAGSSEAEGFPARALHLVAGGISDAARKLNAQSLSSLLSDTRTFAKRNPAIFVLGAAVAGFALMRMIKMGDGDTASHDHGRTASSHTGGHTGVTS